MIGGRGNLTAFSFYANKNLSTAEGGMVTTNDPALYEVIQMLRLHGLTRDAWKRLSTPRLLKTYLLRPGYKCDMPDELAAIGLHQLRKQERFLAPLQRHAGRYDEAFSALPMRRQPRSDDSMLDRHGLHLYVVILEAGRWRVHRDQVIDALLQENIGAALHYRPIHTHPYYREKYGYKPHDYPHAYDVGERILSLPLTPGMSEADAEAVVVGMQKVTGAY